MKCRAVHRNSSRRGFVGVWFQVLLGSAGLTITGSVEWYSWRAKVERPRAEAALQAAGYSLDPVQVCAPELPEAGNFGAAEPLKGIATRKEDLTPEIQARIEAIKALGMLRGKGGRHLAESLLTPENFANEPIDWAAWREWISRGLEWEVPAQKEDAKAVLMALRKKTAAIFPPLLEAARTRKHASFIPSQWSRVSVQVQRGDIMIDFVVAASRLAPLPRILALQMEAALAVGDEKEASSLATVLIALRDLSGADVSFINYLLRGIMERTLLENAQRNISARRMSAPLLVQLQAAFAAETTVRDFERAMVMEMDSFIYMTDHVMGRWSSTGFAHWLAGFMGMGDMKGRQNRVGKIYSDLACAARIRYFLDEMKALKSGGMVGYYRRAKELDEQSRPEPGWLASKLGIIPPEVLASTSRRGYAGLIPAFMYSEMRRRMFLVACALERHRLAGGAPPDTLASLPKKLLPQIPADLDGQAIRFRREKDGWVVWSVGMDLKDDWNGKIPPPPAKIAEKDSPWHVADWQWRHEPR